MSQPSNPCQGQSGCLQINCSPCSASGLWAAVRWADSTALSIRIQFESLIIWLLKSNGLMFEADKNESPPLSRHQTEGTTVINVLPSAGSSCLPKLVRVVKRSRRRANIHHGSCQYIYLSFKWTFPQAPHSKSLSAAAKDVFVNVKSVSNWRVQRYWGLMAAPKSSLSEPISAALGWAVGIHPGQGQSRLASTTISQMEESGNMSKPNRRGGGSVIWTRDLLVSVSPAPSATDFYPLTRSWWHKAPSGAYLSTSLCALMHFKFFSSVVLGATFWLRCKPILP